MPDPLAQLDRLLAEATPGPWQTEVGDWPKLANVAAGTLSVGRNLHEVDAALIVALVNAAPHLIAVAKAAEAHNRHSKAEHCPACKQLRDALAGLRAHLGETEA